MSKVFRLPRLCNLPTRKDNPSRANLRANLVISMTRKDNPYRASRGFYTVCKDSPATLKVNLNSLTLWSNQGNLKDPQVNRVGVRSWRENPTLSTYGATSATSVSYWSECCTTRALLWSCYRSNCLLGTAWPYPATRPTGSSGAAWCPSSARPTYSTRATCSPESTCSTRVARSTRSTCSTMPTCTSYQPCSITEFACAPNLSGLAGPHLPTARSTPRQILSSRSISTGLPSAPRF